MAIKIPSTVKSKFKTIYQEAGRDQIKKQLIAKGIPPDKAEQMANAIITGKEKAPKGISYNIPQESGAIFGLSPMMLIIGVIAIGGIGFYLMQKK